MELGQIEERNNTLTKDNAKLLQRWLDAKQAEANKMNEANEFYEDMRTRRQTNHDGDTTGDSTSSVPVSGNGEGTNSNMSTEMKDGTLSPTLKSLVPTPNG